MEIKPVQGSSLCHLFLVILCLNITSCSFKHLTEVQNLDTSAPTAKECGSCHVEQYSEWQKTAHARAFISPEFKLQSNQYQDQDCLFCHSPGDVQNPDREARSFNRNEGVTCVACHLHNGAMNGPHKSGALFSPHAIAQNDKLNSRIDSSQLCGTCHEETYEQWQSQRLKKQFPTCHGCHGVSTTRTHTKGTGFFSNMLVAFEPEHKVRSHYLIIPDQPGQGIGPDLQLAEIENDTIQFSLTNSLPHDLPTGSFGEKELFLVLSWLPTDETAARKKIIIIPSVIAPGETKVFTTKLPKEGYRKGLSVDLFRFHESTEEDTLIRSYPLIIAPAQPSTPHDKKK